jgi:signal transduction histidine kinase
MEGLYSLIALLLSFHSIHPFLIATGIDKRILWMLVPHLLDNNDMVLKRDKARFSEAMWNLLNNGIKFPEKGRTTSADKKKDDKIPFTITVKDSGSSIDMEYLSKLSIKFVTKSQKGVLLM